MAILPVQKTSVSSFENRSFSRMAVAPCSSSSDLSTSFTDCQFAIDGCLSRRKQGIALCGGIRVLPNVVAHAPPLANGICARANAEELMHQPAVIEDLRRIIATCSWTTASPQLVVHARTRHSTLRAKLGRLSEGASACAAPAPPDGKPAVPPSGLDQNIGGNVEFFM
jgi:hypothetical protein